MRSPHNFSDVFTCKGLALTHLPKCPLRRDNPWVTHTGAELRGRDLQGATNNIRIAPHLARSRAQSMDALMKQLSAILQLKSITDSARNPRAPGTEVAVAWSGQTAKSPRRAHGTSGAPPYMYAWSAPPPLLQVPPETQALLMVIRHPLTPPRPQALPAVHPMPILV